MKTTWLQRVHSRTGQNVVKSVLYGGATLFITMKKAGFNCNFFTQLDRRYK